MTAKEVRAFRTASKRLVETEEKSKLLEELKKRRLCLGEEERFVLSLQSKFKNLGGKRGVLDKCHDDISELAIKYKIRDNILEGKKLRKRRNWLRGRLETSLGNKSSSFRNLVEEVKKNSSKYRQKLKLKNKLKVEHLMKKYGRRKKLEVDKDLLERMGNPKIFVDDKIEKM